MCDQNGLRADGAIGPIGMPRITLARPGSRSASRNPLDMAGPRSSNLSLGASPATRPVRLYDLLNVGTYAPNYDDVCIRMITEAATALKIGGMRDPVLVRI
jgi:hypothetical protein